ncbi:hypothetical protein I215_12263 [Galbibacter marinus]|uniref:Lipoprotein n=1 Tax=Galbibacter marinus TaxID=555500 RepID=K2PSI4_9FLAO|nr:hypothetical protein [Galbibacter marinus]EKF54509.1 hypothetical protein I215_12263 [Galbibacter marinus]
MKKINILLASLFIASFTTSCDKDGEEHPIFENRVIAGVEISIEGEGAIQGVPLNPEDLANSPVDFTVSTLEMHVDKASVEDESLISNFELVKQFNGGEETSVATYESLPFDVSLTELSQFTEGTGISADDLKIGDIFKFAVKVHHANGKSYIYNNHAFNVQVNCFADLSGTYTVTNSYCGAGSTGTIPSVKITKTPDGNWNLETADGGLLQYCTQNTTLTNAGTISVVCGEVSGTTDFCGSNGIGCIVGGSWDQETGVLTLELDDTFFGIGGYTATYTRQ